MSKHRSRIVNIRTSKVYTDLALAAAEAQSGDRLKLGEGNYTLYKWLPRATPRARPHL